MVVMTRCWLDRGGKKVDEKRWCRGWCLKHEGEKKVMMAIWVERERGGDVGNVLFGGEERDADAGEKRERMA